MKNFIIGLLVFVLLGVGAYYYYQSETQKDFEEEYGFREVDPELLPEGLKEADDRVNEILDDLTGDGKTVGGEISFNLHGVKVKYEGNVDQDGSYYRFGPMGFVPEGPVDMESPIYGFMFGDKRDLADLLAEAEGRFSYSVEPRQFELNGFDVIEYAEPGMCDFRALEVLLENSNLLIQTSGCHGNDREVDFAAFEEFVKDMEKL